MADGARVDLPRLAREAGLRSPAPTLPFEPTAAQIATLQRLAARVIAAWNVELRETVLPAYREQIGRRARVGSLALGLGGEEVDALEAALTGAAGRTLATVDATEQDLARFLQGFAAWHTDRFVTAIRRASNVDLGAVLSTSDLEDIMAAATRRNVALIRGLNEDMRRNVERVVFDAWNENSSAAKLTRTLKKDLGFAPARAKLIGRDQISKLAGELDRARHADAGLDKFQWIHSQLPNPREDHLSWHGQIFSWARPPNGVIPGQEINCRCRAAAVIEPR